MQAAVGDRIIVAGAVVGSPARDGEILEVRGPNGEAPYLVRWSDSGRESLFFPGRDAHLHHYEASDSAEDSAGPAPESSVERAAVPPRVRNWHVDLYLYEGDERTAAHAVLHSSSNRSLAGRGTARRRSGEVNVPEIGDEVAVARALHGLADHLLEAASEDMSAVGGHEVKLEPSTPT